MRQMIYLAGCCLLTLPLAQAVALSDEPWKTNDPIVVVEREMAREATRSGTNTLLWRFYVGPKLEIVDHILDEVIADSSVNNIWRFSTDNGRTWSQPLNLPDTLQHHEGVDYTMSVHTTGYDPTSDRLVGLWHRQVRFGGKFHNFCYYATSSDLGRTWSNPKQLRYEPGNVDFDPQNPLNPEFLDYNQAKPASNILVCRDGTLVVAMAHANAVKDPNELRAWRMGSLCFMGKWDPDVEDYRWTAGERIEISPDWSGRGLMEPSAVELTGGRILIIWRGSNNPTTDIQGRKWFSLSTDGGRTLAPVTDLRYDDGTQFYSPSSYHRMLRHSQNGNLYWIGNICPEPPSGNLPRRPLVIAEIDETIPALKKGTVTVIDDLQPGDSPKLQLSNFSTFENRETHAIELFLTRLGANPDDFWRASTYRYILRIK